MSVNETEIVLSTNQTPGIVAFNNFDEVKAYLQAGLETYNNRVYSKNDINQAKDDLAVLKRVKKKLTDKKKELESAYGMPIEKVRSQLDELIEMVKEPYDIIDRMLKENAKEIKEREIIEYAKVKAQSLGVYADKVLSSPSFFNPRWKNATYYERAWKKDVDELIKRAGDEISIIKKLANGNTAAVLGFYFDKLSLDGVDAFIKTIEDDDSDGINTIYVDPETGEVIDHDSIENDDYDENQETGTEKKQYSIIKVEGLGADIRRFIKSADLYNLQISVLDSGDME